MRRHVLSLSLEFLSSEWCSNHPCCGSAQGYDTAVRLVDAQYYGGDIGMAVQFMQLRMRGCTFLVAGRRGASDTFNTLNDISVPEALQVGGSDKMGLLTPANSSHA